jgi:DHA1 family bicyclomycin/chloramphenicol resistance-like MFS transporter
MMKQRNTGPRFGEFVALMAMMMSLVALSIDATLPALPAISSDLGAHGPNDGQLVLTLLFAGFALGQVFYGPLSDSAGRKRTVYLGLALLTAGSVLSLVARSFPVMLTGRFLQGVGVAGPRTIVLALVRDRFEGAAMARVMSFVMTIFILVPIIAPTLGQGVLLFSGWRAIFAVYLGLVLVVTCWFAVRQPETLPPSRRAAFSLRGVLSSAGEVLRTRAALGYTLAAGLVFGAFMAYLMSSQQIFQQQYELGRLFPLFFAIVAIALGCASLVNARLVMSYGMRRLARLSLTTVSGTSLVFLPIVWIQAGHPPLPLLMAYLLIVFFSVGLLFGNLNALAMQPLGHIAGTGAAVVGSLSTFISIVLGTIVGQSYDGTILPLVAGFAVYSSLSLAILYWTEYPLGRAFP